MFMRGFLNIFFKLTSLIIFILSLLILLLHFAALSYGFYFTGDTITYFVPAFPGEKGNLLAVFAWHMENYPPFVSFVLNLLRFLPVSIITQHQIYVILSTLLCVIAAFLIVRIITPIKKLQLVLISLLFFTGSQILMFKLALAEPLFIFFWILTIFAVERFISTRKESFLLLFMFTAGLIPIVKLQGISVLISTELIIAIFTILTYRQKKYSVILVLTCLLIAWLPIFTSSVMNYVLHQSFFGYFDPQTDLNGRKLSYQLMFILSEVSKNSALLLLSGLIIGTQIKWSKHLKYFAILAGSTAFVYYLFVAIGMTKISANEALHLRYLLPAYPELILVSVYLGSVIAYKYPKILDKISFGLIFVVLFLGYNLLLSVKQLNLEIKSPQSFLAGWAEGTGAEHSADIRRFCRGKTENKYLLLKDSSRNWVAQSLGYYCIPIEKIQMENKETFDFPKDSLIFTPYKLNSPKFRVLDLYKGAKQVFLYKTEEPATLDMKQVLKELKFLD